MGGGEQVQIVSLYGGGGGVEKAFLGIFSAIKLLIFFHRLSSADGAWDILLQQ